MVPPKNITEVPRTALPRLTWNGSSRIATFSPTHNTPLSKRQQKQLSIHAHNSLSRKLYSSTSFYSPPIFPVTGHVEYLAVRGLSTSTNSILKHSFAESRGNPVRYNGVYVAAFKPARRAFHASAALARDHHFDTLKFVQRLKDEGFSEEQAVAMMRVLNDVIQESIQNLTRTMVLREG